MRRNTIPKRGRDKANIQPRCNFAVVVGGAVVEITSAVVAEVVFGVISAVEKRQDVPAGMLLGTQLRPTWFGNDTPGGNELTAMV